MTSSADANVTAPFVDRAYYRAVHRLPLDVDPVEHFCDQGWRQLHRPNPDFDVWWYWANHLDPASDDVNPLVHYAEIGRALGLSTRPTTAQVTPGARLPADRPVRRACLFAGFDAEGVLDDATVLLVRELSRHADVFYLADNYMPADELAKLDGIATQAWAVRHGAYDFGSYSMLARDLVGWHRLASYDEVLFVNDSCFLVHALDDLFAEMDARATDWWGLQATKGLASTRHNPRNSFAEPIPLATVKSELLDVYETDPVYDFHVGSYFLAFRRPVLDDPVFRRVVDAVRPERNKLTVILKYEIGLTHVLIGRGFAWDTYVPDLHPFHPLFSEAHFDLIGAGFPLLKRYFLSQNHYDVPDLANWKKRVRAVAPEAPVDLFEQSLRRSAPDDRLRRSLSITRKPDGSVRIPKVPRGPGYARKDATVEKRPDVWVFAVDPARHVLPDNSRAIFEAVKDDAAITKVLLTRSRRIELGGRNVVVEPLLSPAGRKQLLRAGVVLVGSRPRRAVLAPVTPDHQTIVVVRHGLMLERRGRAAANPQQPCAAPVTSGPLPLLHPEPQPAATGVLVASEVDRLAALATYWPATHDQAWATGLPLHDFLVGEEGALPADYRADLDRIRRELGGRRLLLFAPSLRRTGSDRPPYVFSDAERDALRSWSEDNDIAIGLRHAPGDLERPYAHQLGELALDLSEQRFPALPAVLRASDAVLTDFAGAALDLAVTGRPVVSFVPDLPEVEDDLLYDLDHFFPGPVTRDFDGLTAALTSLFDQPVAERYDLIRDLLVDRRDGANTARVVARIQAEQEVVA